MVTMVVESACGVMFDKGSVTIHDVGVFRAHVVPDFGEYIAAVWEDWILKGFSYSV